MFVVCKKPKKCSTKINPKKLISILNNHLLFNLVIVKAKKAFHKKSKNIVTLTAVRPPARFGAIKLKGSKENPKIASEPADTVNPASSAAPPKAPDTFTPLTANWKPPISYEL